jgi:hypothetical protein
MARANGNGGETADEDCWLDRGDDAAGASLPLRRRTSIPRLGATGLATRRKLDDAPAPSISWRRCLNSKSRSDENGNIVIRGDRQCCPSPSLTCPSRGDLSSANLCARTIRNAFVPDIDVRLRLRAGADFGSAVRRQDLFDVAGHVTDRQSRLAAYARTRDANRQRGRGTPGAGAEMVGKTITDELAFSSKVATPLRHADQRCRPALRAVCRADRPPRSPPASPISRSAAIPAVRPACRRP